MATQTADLNIPQLQAKTARVFDALQFLRSNESPEGTTRAEALNYLEREIVRIGKQCDGVTGWSDPEDPWSEDSVGMMRVEFAELTWPQNPYPIPPEDPRPRTANGRDVEWYSRGRWLVPAGSKIRLADGSMILLDMPLEGAERPSEAIQHNPGLSTCQEFITALFSPYGDKGWIQLRGLGPKGKAATLGGQTAKEPKRHVLNEWFHLPQMVADCTPLWQTALRWMEEERMDIYIGVLPRGVPGKGRKTDVYEAAAAWVELDFDKQDGGEPQVKRLAEKSDADIIVYSGGGIHLYWVIPIPLELTAANVERWEKSLKGRQSKMKADPTHDITRILRLPGTYNFKYASGPRKVELIRCR